VSVRWSVTLWAALLLGLGALGLSAGWSGPGPAAVLVAAAVAPLPVFALAAWLRVPAPVTALVILGLAAAAAYLFVLAPEGTDAATAIRDSVPRLHTARRPAPPDSALLLPGLVTALLVGVWAALRTVTPAFGSARPPGTPRGRGLVAAPAGSLVLYTGGALLTAGTGDRTGVLAGAIIALTAAGWLGLEPFRRATPASRIRTGLAHRVRSVAGRPLTAAFAGGTVLALAVVAHPVGAFEPRTLVVPPHRTINEPSPLPQLTGWHEQAGTELFRVVPVDGDRPARLRLVTLSTYTGVAWSASAIYRPVGVAGGTTLPGGRERRTTAAEFTIASLAGIWLPGLGHPLDVSLSNVDYEAEGGSLALVAGTLRPGLRYRVLAEQDAPAADQLTTAGVPRADAAGPLLELPRVPPVFAEYARQITFGASTPFQQAVAIERAVGERRYDPLAPVGSSYARLDTFLFQPEGTLSGAQIGSSEQFAAAFAVLARSVGLPSRVVLGFRGTVDGVVRGRDALAWPEVYFSGFGWFPFSPTPGTADPDLREVTLLALDRLDEQAERVTVVPTTTVPRVETAGPPRPVSASPPVAAAPARRGPDLLGPAATVAAAVLLTIGILAMLRAGRRARHRRAGVRGAWSEVLDLLVLIGRPVPATWTATDIAADLATIAPRADGGATHPALRIAVAADRAAFGPDSDGRPPGPEATQAWSSVRLVRRAVRAAVPLRRRLLWTVDPRPLRRRR
jgi:transglutaminase-like putative cysteine protease